MPNIIRNDGFVLTDKKVKIPDFFTEGESKLSDEENSADEMSLEDSENADGLNEDVSEQQEVQEEPVVNVPVVPSFEEFAEIYKQELSEVCQQMADKAYSDALLEKRNEIQNCLNEVSARLNEMQEMQNRYLEQYSQELKYMAVDIAEKFIMQEIQKNDMLLSDLILQTVGNIKNSDWLKVEVSDKLVQLVDFLKSELNKPKYQGKVYLSPISAGNDTCRIVSKDGTIVATVSVQAENLRRLFSKI